jgi:FKBP-type peptidyl-prolyl cis-trans isomerase 2
MRTFKRKWLVLTIFMFFIMISTGCLDWGGSSGDKKSFEFDLIGSTHKLAAGDSTTYVFLLKSNSDENDSIGLTLDKMPSNWDVLLSKNSVNITGKQSTGIIMMVNTSVNSEKGKHDIKIQGESSINNKKNSISISTEIIEPSEDVVEEGDKVDVNYVGYLWNFEVFDTSYQTPSFRGRDKLTPLKTFVGPNDLDPGDEYISTVEGFWKGCLALDVGQSRTVVLDPHEAYGDFENATINITETVPMIESMSIAEFRTNYPIEGEPQEGIVTRHHFWDWNISVDYVNDTENIVRILNEPYLSQSLDPYGWNSEVIYKNRSDDGGIGRILVEHNPQLNMDATYQNYKARVKDIDDGIIHLEYNISNHDLGDKILIFDITLVRIEEI